MSGVLVLDPELAGVIVRRRAEQHPDQIDECWEGVIVMPPVANTEHQRIVMRLAEACSAVIDWDAGEQAVPGGNVSDRDADWTTNYRVPDVIVALAGGRAVDRGPFWLGGPDLVMEVISGGEGPRSKLDFYAAVGCREVVIVCRDPWAVELHRLTAGRLELVGRSVLTDPVELPSDVLPLVFQLVPCTDRPRVLVTHPSTGRTVRA